MKVTFVMYLNCALMNLFEMFPCCQQCKTNNSYCQGGTSLLIPYKTHICINTPLIFSIGTEFFLLSNFLKKKKVQYQIQCNGYTQITGHWAKHVEVWGSTYFCLLLSIFNEQA